MWVIFCPFPPKLANMKTVKSFITFPKTGKMYKVILLLMFTKTGKIIYQSVAVIIMLIIYNLTIKNILKKN